MGQRCKITLMLYDLMKYRSETTQNLNLMRETYKYYTQIFKLLKSNEEIIIYLVYEFRLVMLLQRRPKVN